MARVGSLSTILWELAESVANIAKQFREEGKISEIKRVYIKRKFQEFQFKDGTISKTQWSNDFVEKSEWQLGDLFKFLEEAKKLPEYSKTRTLICRRYSVSEPQAEFWLSRLVTIASQRDLSEPRRNELIPLITTFISELEGGPRHWNVRIWLNGVWTRDEEVMVYNGLTLRHPRQNDFEIEIPLDLALFHFDSGMSLGQGQNPSAILELEKRASGQPELLPEVEELLMTFRLYRVGSVAALKTDWISDSMIGFGSFTTSQAGTQFPTDKYCIEHTDLPSLQEFMKRIRPLLPKEMFRGEAAEYLATSLQRYNDAILKPESAVSRITFAIMSLEALYLKKGERAELQHRLGQRMSKLLSCFGREPMEVYNTISHCYEIRSKFVHGEPLEKENTQYALQTLSKVLEYCRSSIVIMLQTKEKTPKEQFLNSIDNSLLSQQADKKLQEKITETCPVH